MLDRDQPFETVVGYRNWKYTQDGRLYNINGVEVGTDGKPLFPVEHTVPEEVLDDVVNSVFEPDTDPNEMTTDELKDELRTRGVSIIGKFKHETLVAKVKEARNVEG